MTRSRSTALLLIALAATGCRKPEPEQATGEHMERILASIPDSAMRERWRAAQASGQMAPLESLRIPVQRVLQRSFARSDTVAYQSPPPGVPAGALAETRVHSAVPLDEYRGAFQLVSLDRGKIVGRLTERAEPVEIYFKVPGGSQTLALRDSALTFVLQQGLVGGSFRRTTLLSGSQGVVLFDLSDGDSRRPYAREFKDLALSVRQGPAGDAAAGVSVSYAGQRLVLQPGKPQRARDQFGEVELFLLENFTTPPAAARGAEADAYHVRLFIWRVG